MKRPSEFPAGDSVDTPSVFWVGGLILLGAVLMQFSLAIFFGELKRGQPPIATTRAPAGRAPLEIDDGEELARVRSGEERLLNTYGWSDRGRGLVRVPIERAMRWLVERGAARAVEKKNGR